MNWKVARDPSKMFETPNWPERVEQYLFRAFEVHREKVRLRTRSSFSPIYSIVDLSLEEILNIVKSKNLVDWINGYDGHSGALIFGGTATGKTISVYGACLSVVARMKIPPLEELSGVEPSGHVYELVPSEWPNPLSSDIFVTSGRSLGHVIDSHKLGSSEPEEISDAKRSKLLLIDDVGWERPHQSHVISDVLASRYDFGKATVITTGMTLGELRDRYGDAVIRRMVEAGGKKGAIVEA